MTTSDRATDLTYVQALAARNAARSGRVLIFDVDGDQHQHEEPVKSHRKGAPFCCSGAECRWEMDELGE